jgi:large subunit ribosomal protein L24
MDRIRRDDQVLILAGKERGKRGQVREVVKSQKRVFVQGMNLVQRHQKQRSEREQAGIISKEAALHVSNVKLICKACQKPTRVGTRVRTDGVKVRVCKQCEEDMD